MGMKKDALTVTRALILRTGQEFRTHGHIYVHMVTYIVTYRR